MEAYKCEKVCGTHSENQGIHEIQSLGAQSDVHGSIIQQVFRSIQTANFQTLIFITECEYSARLTTITMSKQYRI